MINLAGPVMGLHRVAGGLHCMCLLRLCSIYVHIVFLPAGWARVLRRAWLPPQA